MKNKLLYLFLVSLFIFTFSGCITSAEDTPIIDKPSDNTSIILDSGLFSVSFPNTLKIGESYTVKVNVRNEGPENHFVLVNLEIPTKFVYTLRKTEIFYLKKGETQDTSFLITPIISNLQGFYVTVNVYTMSENEGSVSLIKEDSVSKRCISEKSFGSLHIILVVLVIILILFILKFYLINLGSGKNK